MSAEVDKWLTIGLGFAGDQEAAPALADVVKNDSDRYVRFMAITAYARAARSAAIPLLETFKDDMTETEYGEVPMYLLRTAAREAISAIQEGKIRQVNAP